jgi:hypothetical protein
MKRRYIAEQWNDYLARVIPPNASKLQIKETKRAFYAGAHSLLMAVCASVSAGDETTPADIEIMTDIQAEAEAFAEDLKAGRA